MPSSPRCTGTRKADSCRWPSRRRRAATRDLQAPGAAILAALVSPGPGQLGPVPAERAARVSLSRAGSARRCQQSFREDQAVARRGQCLQAVAGDGDPARPGQSAPAGPIRSFRAGLAVHRNG